MVAVLLAYLDNVHGGCEGTKLSPTIIKKKLKTQSMKLPENFMTSTLWDQMLAKDPAVRTKMRVYANFFILKIGLQCPSEQTVKTLAASCCSEHHWH